jgi:hypothetical protein
MSNTQRLGSNWRGRAWDDGEPIPRVTFPDGTLGEAVAALGYQWDATNSVWVKEAGAAKFATISTSTNGASTLVAAVATKKIRVLSYVLIANGAVNVKFQSHTTPTDLSGLLYLVANTGASSGFSPLGHFESTAGEALDINLSGNVAVGGHLSYVEV